MESNWECEVGYKAMPQLLENRPRPAGIFSAHDRIAIGAIRAIFDAGLSVPEDFSIIGLDNIEVSSFVQPTLTTVHQSFAEMTALSVQILLELTSGKKSETQIIVLEPRFINRKSTCPPKSQS